MSYGRSRGVFDGLPIPADKSYLREELSRVDESWTAARFDSLPHVVHILTSKDREGEVRILKEQSEVIEEVVDEVVHAYHSGFNKAIQNYSQILKLFSESADSISALKVDLADARELLGSRNKQLQQMWYRSLTLRHIISILDQIESVSKVPTRIEKLIAGGQLYAAVQLHVQSSLMLEREGLQVVGALQDVRSELVKLRNILFYKILEDLHSHLYNRGEYSSFGLSLTEEDSIPSTTGASICTNNSQPLSRRTRSQKSEYQLGLSTVVDRGFAFDGHDDGSVSEASDVGMNNAGSSYQKDARLTSRKIPVWLSNSTPDEFIETIKKSDVPVSTKYLQTLVECLCMIGKVAAAGAIICQRLRPTIHEIITTKIKTLAADHYSSKPINGQALGNGSSFSHFTKSLEGYHVTHRKAKNGTSFVEPQLVISPVSPSMTPKGKAQVAASELLGSIMDSITHILENHIIVAELLESKSSQQGDNVTPKSINGDMNWNPDAEPSQSTGGFSLGFSLTVIQSECQQLICEILRATPEAASADAAVQTARLASKAPNKDKREATEGLSFAFRFTEATSLPNQGLTQGWKKGPNVPQEGYGTCAALPEQGIYLAASVYRPVVQFTDKIGSLLPQKYSQLGNDGLLAFVENFLKDHFLPAMFVDYRKYIQQAISNSAAFRPRPHSTTTYSPLIEMGRPVLQGLLATDLLAKEVLAWAQSMPKYAGDLFDYVQTFLERTYERCRTSYMEAVLERQSYMLIGRPDIENLMRTDPANACFSSSKNQLVYEKGALDAETIELETRFSDLLLSLRPIKQENLIRDDNKFILLASLSDSLEYVAESIERLGDSILRQGDNGEEYTTYHYRKHARTPSALPKNLATLAAEYRKLAIDCVKVLRMEMQLETIFHMQEMIRREYMEDQDAEEPDEFVIALTSQILRRDEELAPFVPDTKRNYIFGGVCSIAANASIKALAEMKAINLLGVQQICRNSIAIEQALATIPLIDNEAVQQRLDRVRTYYELLNLPFEALLAFITEHQFLFTLAECSCLLKVGVPGREIPDDAVDQVYRILSH